jgi:hypothetical protein
MDEEEVTPEPTPKWVLEADRAHKRYEIAREVLAAMVGANVSTSPTRDGTTTWPDSDLADAKIYSGFAMACADALLAALEGE